MVMIIRISVPTMICQELVLTLTRKALDLHALLETGLLFIGLEDSRMEELSLTPRWKEIKDQRLSLSVTTKFSNAGILHLPNSIKVISEPLTAHPTLLTEMLSPGHQLEENQSHSIPISTLRSRFLSAAELQNSFNNHLNQ